MIKKLIFIIIFIFSRHLIGFSQTEERTNNITDNDENLLDSLKSLMSEYSTNCYKIEISFNGYEAGSDESWYYDSLGVICGYHLTWDMEGQSGLEFNWYEKGKLSAVYEETQGQEGEPDITFLKKPTDSDKLKSYKSETRSQEQKIFNAINDNPEQVSDDEYTISVNIEETVNYGFDFVQTTKIYIDKALYELLFKKE